MWVLISLFTLLTIALSLSIRSAMKGNRERLQSEIEKINKIGDYIFVHLNIYSDDFEYHYNPETYIKILFKDKSERWCVLTESYGDRGEGCFSLCVFKKYVPRDELELDDRLYKEQYHVLIDLYDSTYPNNYIEGQCNLLSAFITLSKKLHDKEYQEEKGVIFEENSDSDITKEKVINNTLIQFSNNVQDYHKQLL